MLSSNFYRLKGDFYRIAIRVDIILFWVLGNEKHVLHKFGEKRMLMWTGVKKRK